jgi:hypothetical protein
MLRPWISLLPLFVVKAIARRHCEVFEVQGRYWARATEDVLVLTIITPKGKETTE